MRAGATTLADNGIWWTFTIPVLMNKIYPANGATGLGSLVIATRTALPNNGYSVCWDTFDNNTCDTDVVPITHSYLGLERLVGTA